MDPQLQQAQQQQQPVRMVYAHPHPQQASLPPLPVQSVRQNTTNNMMVMNQGNISSSTIANHNTNQMINHGLQSSSTLQQQQHPIKQRVSPPTNMMMNNTNPSTNSNTVNHNGILQPNPQQVVMMATPSGNHQPLVIDQVPILYQTPSPSLSQQSLPTQQVLIPNNQQQNQQFHHSYNNQQQNQQTNLYNNLQASSTLMYNSNSMPSVSPKFNTSPNSQPSIPFSATTTALNQSINSNLMSSQQESNYESWRPPSVSTTNLNNNNNNSNKKNSPPSPSPITKFANKVMDILTPNEKATYVNLSPENQPVSTQNVATNHKPKAAVKGLSNPMGEYNCFLNVVIQSLWNLEIFRELFLSIDPKNHKHKSFESCVYCALQNLFTHFKYSENSILDPNLVRNSLSFAHNKDSKFQLKHMDDASEVFQAIIEDINNSLEYSQIPIFDFYVTDFYVCSKCNKFSDPHNYTTTNWCISSCEFVQKKRENPSVTFEGALRSTIESFHRTCESCKEVSDSQKHIFQAFPAVTSFSFSWNRDVISEDDILEFMCYFKIKEIKLHEIFRLNCNGSDIEVMGHVSSIICYYGRHYICLVYNKKLGSWFAIDDSNVRQIDADRLDDFIVSSKFQPCVVLVEVDSHKGNIKIENKMKEKTTTNEIELISPNKKRMATSDVFPSKNEESSPINESQFTVLDQHFGVIIEGFNAVTDFFYWNRKISKHADIYTRTITLTKDQIQNMSSQLNICIYLGTLELLENETVTVRLSCTQNQKNKTPPVVIGKLDNRKKSTFTSIPIGFLITENSKNYELNFYIKKEKIIQ